MTIIMEVAHKKKKMRFVLVGTPTTARIAF